MFSKACEYAIRAVIYIAAKGEIDNKIGIDEICKQIEAPKHFTAKILQALTRRHLVSSKKGVNGGFFMEKEQCKKKLVEIVDAIDGNQLFTGCGLGLKTCSEKEPCPLHDKFKLIRNGLSNMLEETSIESMAKKLEKGKRHLKSI